MFRSLFLRVFVLWALSVTTLPLRAMDTPLPDPTTIVTDRIPHDTGDRLLGVPVVSALDLKSLSPGRHLFYVRVGARNTGDPVHVPVIILKGEKPGPKLALAAGIHGDELNGIAVIHRLTARLDTDSLAGILVAVPGINRPGMIANNRHFVGSTGGGFMVDLNRSLPGRTKGGGPAGLYAGTVWKRIFKGRFDLAIDLHTQTRGLEYPLFVFADFDNPQAESLARALMPDIIKKDAGENGTLETTLLASGVPAVTFEIGAPKRFQETLVSRAIAGVENVMRLRGMIAGTVVYAEKQPVIGTHYSNIYTKTGGIAVIHVALLEAVAKGQHVATLYDPFGREIERYTAPHAGAVLALATDPLREPGSMLVRILK
ncbi:succinylglutamate desuccinylase/aspartoacylase family protein [Eilatimonas milleporae]|uniref:Succinylglutamate desuccinylase/Aspartoacylase catalytic domain-containing protein n=1 Tax=Eilatimonas milleporae TaxID=911205 RepID=A0A3M0C7E4_9PROT|nr:succinylglutamate desuccinylase/aspartoacylase family protein [Eilatimonas milleporae]RMB02726.1 hypothetical protein BXY39_3077 [Eilatimonas milleporae]